MEIYIMCAYYIKKYYEYYYSLGLTYLECTLAITYTL